MLSEQAQKAINFCRKYIKPSTTSVPTTIEEAQKARKGADEGNKYTIPEDVTVKSYDENGVKGEFYLRNDSAKNAILMFLHGGGYISGTVYSRRKLAIRIGKVAKLDVFSVDYRQYPESKHPDGQNDVVNAYKFLRSHYKQVFVFGESAGGTYALTLSFQMRDEGIQLPDRISVFSPVINQLNTSLSEYVRSDRDPMMYGAVDPMPYFDEPAKKDPLISPIYGDYHDFPPMLINCGSEEVKYDSSAILNHLCQTAGVDVQWHVWEGLFHVFVLFDMPETDLAIKQIGEFFKAGLKEG